MDINQILNNEENLYLGHGTKVEDDQIINSIMENGLRCSHGSLYFTTVALGKGCIEEESKGLLKNWPHCDSKVVMIVSLPNKFRILDVIGSGTYNKGDAAFYYVPNSEQREQHSLTESPYLMPEFVAGYYDARNDTFTSNPKYYENLPKEQQDILFEQIKENYYNVVSQGWNIHEYKEIITDLGWEFPLSNEEIKSFSIKNKGDEILSSIAPELLNKNLRLPSGEEVTAEKYIREIVLPFFTDFEYIILANGVKIPFSHFLMECVIFDCQDRYDGDFAGYVQDNVDIQKTLEHKNSQVK